MMVKRAAGCLVGVGVALFVGCGGGDDEGGSTPSAGTAGTGGTSAGGTSAGGTSAGGVGGKSGGGLGGSKPTSCPSTVTVCSAGKETTFSCDPCSSPFMQDCNAPDFHVKCAGGTCVPQGMSCGGAGAGGAGAAGTGGAGAAGTGGAGAAGTGGAGGAGTGGGGAGGGGSAGASGGGAAGAGGAAGSPIGAGPFTIVYAAEEIGVDVRTNTAATFDATGLASYDALPMEKPTRGSCMVADAGGDATAVLGRWTAGTTGGNYFGKTYPFAVNEGFHYVIGASTQALPASGTVGYTLLGATAPTLKGGGNAPGSTTGSANVAFAAGVAKIGLSFDVVVDAKYTLSTTGGTADPSTSELATVGGAFNWGGLLSVSGAGVACQSANGKPCQAFVQGAFVGVDGDHLAVNFAIQATGNGGDGVHGVVLLRK